MREIDEQDYVRELTPKTQIQAVGVDIASISKIARLINDCDRETLSLVFSDREQNYCQSVINNYTAYALCFGIKEAVGKALGMGLLGIDWCEIEADLTQEQILVCLSEKAKIQAQRLNIKQWLVDWWEWQDSVLVNVLAFSEEHLNE